jgi:hypothetical protein
MSKVASTPDKLNLSGRNLEGVILAGLDLRGAILFRANLRKANLRGAILFGADLREANLCEANLSYANLSRAFLQEAILRGADLSKAFLFRTSLHGANLFGADLRGADLSEANLRGAILFRADLREANLSRAFGVVMESKNAEDTASALHIRITEAPLIAHNFTTIISALTELHTKAWLIQQRRFPDLLNYAHTHDIRFTKEANLTIGKLTHNSPTQVELILNPTTLAAAAGAVVTLAGALKIAIDNIGQTSLRLKEKELDREIRRQAAQQARQTTAQKAGQERQKAQLEIARKRLEVEKNRVEVALETASKMVDTLRSGIDKETKGMLEQALLPSLLQLSSTEGLELALPAVVATSYIRSEKRHVESGMIVAEQAHRADCLNG